MPKLSKYKVTVVRTASRAQDFMVKARDVDEAKALALAVAPSKDFFNVNDEDADYTVRTVTRTKKAVGKEG